MQPEQRRNSVPGWFILLAGASALVILLVPLWIPVHGHDGIYHLNWIAQFTEQFRAGDLYPRWMGESFSGFGSPVFYYYPPLAYHIAAVVSLLGITDPAALFKIVVYLSLILSFFTARLYLKKLTADTTAVTIGALIYALAPYRAIDLVFRNAWSEYVALAWVPLFFLVAEKYITSRDWRDTIRNVIYLAGLVALMIVTNIPAIIVTLPVVTIYMLVVAPRNAVSIIAFTAIAAILGTLFAGIVTFPLFAFGDYLNTEDLWLHASTIVGYTFDTIGEPNYRFFGYFLLAVSALVLVTLILLTRLRRKRIGNEQANRQWALVVIFALSLFMQIPVISEPVYHIPPLRYIQFAYRWDLVVTLLISAAAVILLLYQKRAGYFLSAATLLCSAAIVFVVADRGISLEHPEARIRERDDPGEYLSFHAKREPRETEIYYSERTGVFEIVGGFTSVAPTIQLKRRTPTEYKYSVNAQDTGRIAINLSHFPTWQAYRNGAPIASMYDDYGRRVIPITTGDYELTVVRETSTAERYGLVATILGVLIVFGAYSTERKRPTGSSQT